MTSPRFVAMQTCEAEAFRNGSPDANGNPPERQVSDGGGNPCRHCLADIAAGDDMLVLSYRPLSSKQPYSETGPVFLHTNRCRRCDESSAVPETLAQRDQVLIRGYGKDDRIVYGTGGTVQVSGLVDRCAELLDDPRVVQVHVRSATNSCFQCRVEPD